MHFGTMLEAELFYRALLDLEAATDLVSILEVTRSLTKADFVHVELEHDGNRRVRHVGLGEVSRALADLATASGEHADVAVGVGRAHAWPIGTHGVLYLHTRVALSVADRGRLKLLARCLESFADVLERRLAGRHVTLREETRAFQRRRALEVLARTDWNVAATSRALGIARSNLYQLVGDLAGLRRRWKP